MREQDSADDGPENVVEFPAFLNRTHKERR